jgi:hypothetical protein
MSFSPDSKHLAISAGSGLIVAQVNTTGTNFEPVCCERPGKEYTIISLQWIDPDRISYIAHNPSVTEVDGGIQIFIRTKLNKRKKRNDQKTTPYWIDEDWNYRKASYYEEKELGKDDSPDPKRYEYRNG